MPRKKPFAAQDLRVTLHCAGNEQNSSLPHRDVNHDILTAYCYLSTGYASHSYLAHKCVTGTCQGCLYSNSCLCRTLDFPCTDLDYKGASLQKQIL